MNATQPSQTPQTSEPAAQARVTSEPAAQESMTQESTAQESTAQESAAQVLTSGNATVPTKAPVKAAASVNASTFADGTQPEQTAQITQNTETPRELAPPVEFSWGGYFQAIGVMFLLLGCLWGVLWVVRKYAKFRFIPVPDAFPRNGLRVETQMPLGPKKGLFVVRYLNKRLLLGVTEQQITLLKETPFADPEDAPSASGAPGASGEPASEHDAKTFAALLAEEGAPDHDPKRKF